MDESEILTATEASRSFSEVLHRVCYGGESFIIKKGSRLMARIVPVTEAEIAPEPAQPQAEPVAAPRTRVFDGIVASAAAEAQPTADEAEYFKTVLEQLRRPVLEDA